MNLTSLLECEHSKITGYRLSAGFFFVILGEANQHFGEKIVRSYRGFLNVVINDD